MTITTKSFDDAVYKLVPVILLDQFPEQNMNNFDEDAVGLLNQWGIDIVLTPADLPGVVTHSGESVEAALLSDCDEGTHPKYGRGYFFTENSITPLFTHADPAEIEQLRQRVADLESTLTKEMSLVASLEQLAEISQRRQEKEAQLAHQDGARPTYRSESYLAAINCAHTIDDEKIILHRDKKKPGNALAQLGERLNTCSAPQTATDAPTEVPGFYCSLAAIGAHDPRSFIEGAKWVRLQPTPESVVVAALEAAIGACDNGYVTGPSLDECIDAISALDHGAIIQTAREKT
jgi:hypothetical protein